MSAAAQLGGAAGQSSSCHDGARVTWPPVLRRLLQTAADVKVQKWSPEETYASPLPQEPLTTLPEDQLLTSHLALPRVLAHPVVPRASGRSRLPPRACLPGIASLARGHARQLLSDARLGGVFPCGLCASRAWPIACVS